MKHGRHRQVVRSALGERKGAPSPRRRSPANDLHGRQVDIDPAQARIGCELPSSGAYAGVVLPIELGVVVEHIVKGLPKGIVRVGDLGNRPSPGGIELKSPPRMVKLPAVLGAEPRTLCICLRFSDSPHSGKMCLLATHNRPRGPCAEEWRCDRRREAGRRRRRTCRCGPSRGG